MSQRIPRSGPALRLHRASELLSCALVLSACATPGELEPLEVASRSPHGHWHAEMMLRSGEPDEWVVHLRRSSGAGFDLTLPSVASAEGERTVSRRRPKLFWEPRETRLLVETIGSGFVAVYLPADGRPFYCEHRVLSPEDVPEGFLKTPTLTRLEQEILTDAQRPHSTAEQRYVLEAVERAGPASERGAALVSAVLDGSDNLDLQTLARLVSQRLSAGGGLAEQARREELRRLREPFERFAAAVSPQSSRQVQRAAMVLGLINDEETKALVAPALSAGADRDSSPLEAAAAVDAMISLAWLSGRWQIGAASEPLKQYLSSRTEVPWKTRMARAVALWAAVRLRRPDVVAPMIELTADLVAWSTGGRRSQMPADEEAIASPAWASEIPLGIVIAWAAVRCGDRSAVPALSRLLQERSLPRGSAQFAAKALWLLDRAAARPAIGHSPALTERFKRDLLSRQQD